MARKFIWTVAPLAIVPDGNGKASPALAGNAILQTANPTSTINIVLSGSAVPATHTALSSLTMAPYADLLNDEQIGQVVSFIQTSWGNRGGAASTDQVSQIRKTAKPVSLLSAESFALGRSGTLPFRQEPPHLRNSISVVTFIIFRYGCSVASRRP